MSLTEIGNVNEYNIISINPITSETTTFRVDKNFQINTRTSYNTVQNASKALTALTTTTYSDTNLLTNVSVTNRLKDIQTDNSWVITEEVTLTTSIATLNRYTTTSFTIDVDPTIPTNTIIGSWIPKPKISSTIYSAGVLTPPPPLSYNSAQNRKMLNETFIHAINQELTHTTSLYLVNTTTLQIAIIPFTIILTSS